ncbi:phosphoribosylanthranilate isomerase [Candidatus Galacturonibacter soehngenii]|uniref:N-(5'-phosphoribosyl)anthranilate isomerase n=1 Tax=Candidatus Galacturonatibacter soehngenii TaxID=2307010 RepID=A0A7V7QJ25_9FIRM|nr:phosphoribosylanthranilate isomerase [Candidatus Galacturonibacter soehngenii]KAB1437537.1 phosphoribosylanthranilate isomerase [Candidatus Galacturonibacter soehngenii]
MAVKIKICGITSPEESKYLINNQVDYMGIVLFYPKSKRNKSISEAREILKSLSLQVIKKVAVTVSPTIQQVREIEALGFDYIQIHGTLSKETFDEIQIPILRAFNGNNLNMYEVYHNCPKIHGYVFDAAIPGGGKTFDWSILSQFPRDDKLFILAGGLHADNVAEAIEKVRPDVVDVSSGVEGTKGKDALKINEFVENVKKTEQKGK